MAVYKKRIIEAISFTGAVVGALFVSLNIGIGAYGYKLFLASNIASIILLRKSNASKVIEWQTYIFVTINVIGILRHWI